jgi:hypothetical protein
MRARCRIKRHKVRCGDSDPSSGQRPSPARQMEVMCGCGRRYSTFGMRPYPKWCPRGGKTFFRRYGRYERFQGRRRASPGHCHHSANGCCSLPLSAAPSRGGHSMRVPTRRQLQAQTQCARAGYHYLIAHYPSKRSGALLRLVAQGVCTEKASKRLREHVYDA